MAIQVLNNRALLRFQEDFADIRVTASAEVESGTIKRLTSGAVLRIKDNAASQIGNFTKEEVGNLTINIDQQSFENVAEICAAIPAFIQSIKNEITQQAV